MKGNIENLPISTIKMFFEILSEKEIPHLIRYFDLPDFKEYHPTIQEMINDLNSISNLKIPQNTDKNYLVNLYKRLEDAINAFQKKGIDDDLRFISKEIKSINLELSNLK